MQNLYNGETPYRDYVYNPRDYTPRKCMCGCKKITTHTMTVPLMNLFKMIPEGEHGIQALHVVKCKGCDHATTGNKTLFEAIQEWNKLNCIRQYDMGEYTVKINSYNIANMVEADGIIDQIENEPHEIHIDKNGYFVITISKFHGDFEYRFKLESITEFFPG